MNVLKQKGPKNMKDLAARNYFSHEDVFADLFNVFLYQGEEVIKPGSLIPLDVSEIYKKGDRLIERRRDVVKMLAVKSDGKRTYMILGLECQSKEDWRMAIRMMMYDAMRYDEQLQNKSSRKEMRPVISVVINLSGKRWSGPKSIQEIFEVSDPKFLRYISDYRMNLIDPHQMNEEEIQKFKSDLRFLMILMRADEDVEKTKEVIKDKKWLKKMSREAKIFTNAYFGTDLEEQEEKEEMKKKHALVIAMEEIAREMAVDMAQDMAQDMVQKKEQEITQEMTQKMQEQNKQTARKMMESGIAEELILTCCQVTKKEIENIRQELALTGN